jgi:hypothetical protein
VSGRRRRPGLQPTAAYRGLGAAAASWLAAAGPAADLACWLPAAQAASLCCACCPRLRRSRSCTCGWASWTTRCGRTWRARREGCRRSCSAGGARQAAWLPWLCCRAWPACWPRWPRHAWPAMARAPGAEGVAQRGCRGRHGQALTVGLRPPPPHFPAAQAEEERDGREQRQPGQLHDAPAQRRPSAAGKQRAAPVGPRQRARQPRRRRRHRGPGGVQPLHGRGGGAAQVRGARARRRGPGSTAWAPGALPRAAPGAQDRGRWAPAGDWHCRARAPLHALCRQWCTSPARQLLVARAQLAPALSAPALSAPALPSARLPCRACRGPRAYLAPSPPPKYHHQDTFKPHINEKSKVLATRLRPPDMPAHEVGRPPPPCLPCTLPPSWPPFWWGSGCCPPAAAAARSLALRLCCRFLSIPPSPPPHTTIPEDGGCGCAGRSFCSTAPRRPPPHAPGPVRPAGHVRRGAGRGGQEAGGAARGRQGGAARVHLCAQADRAAGQGGARDAGGGHGQLAAQLAPCHPSPPP